MADRKAQVLVLTGMELTSELLLLLGCADRLLQTGDLSEVETYCGCSVGAVVALLLAMELDFNRILVQAAKTGLVPIPNTTLTQVAAILSQIAIDTGGVFDIGLVTKPLVEVIMTAWGYVPTLN